ncbi:hypothetical protein [uncultured Sphaerochaeta sp.]|uniref:hypothetical protein n=1 Tax=uncultured Sphaerochaeta sp. TaxID=886478 RepID=UPI002A0A2050|nr:hypothetical protein [uncultured Sphaerochaeta sp.]
MQDTVIKWLLDGDVSIQYLTHTTLLASEALVVESLQKRIEREGYGKKLLSCQTETGHWGLWFYQPKWTSTHYTLYALRQLGIHPEVEACRQMVKRTFDECMLSCGGMNMAKSTMPSDIAIDGMFLDYAAYFCREEERIETLVAYLLTQRKPQGGYSWNYDSPIGDPHTTICVIEGFLSYLEQGIQNYTQFVQQAVQEAIEFILAHDLFWDDDKRYQKLTYPHYYHYDILRFLVAASRFNYPCDKHIRNALHWLKNKEKDGFWDLEYIHPGAVHLVYEQKREKSRFITYKALTVLKTYG